MNQTIWEWLGFCKHRWKEVANCAIEDEGNRKIGDKWTLQCEKCGDIKFRKSI